MGVATVLYDCFHPLQQAYARVAHQLAREEGLATRFVRYHHQYYSELARQRQEILAEIKAGLNSVALSDYSFKSWQRVIRFKYAGHPLCVRGSLALPGGRFNVGKIAPELFPTFSALYIASDKRTALAEVLGQESIPGSPFSAEELALANPASIVALSVSGHLECVFDVRQPEALKTFIRLTKDFTLSADLKKQAKKLPVSKPRLITTAPELHRSVLVRDWRSVPTLCEIPSNGQIFGQLVRAAGISAVLYSSTLTRGDCLAIFPENFLNTSSWVALDDELPPAVVGPVRVDSSNWELTERIETELPAPAREVAAELTTQPVARAVSAVRGATEE